MGPDSPTAWVSMSEALLGAWHFFRFDAIALDRSLVPELLGTNMLHLPSTCAAQRSPEVIDMHTELSNC